MLLCLIMLGEVVVGATDWTLPLGAWRRGVAFGAAVANTYLMCADGSCATFRDMGEGRLADGSFGRVPGCFGVPGDGRGYAASL